MSLISFFFFFNRYGIVQPSGRRVGVQVYEINPCVLMQTSIAMHTLLDFFSFDITFYY